jgi:hypothetical protein
MSEKVKPCCPGSTIRNIKMIEVLGQEIGLAQLDQTIRKVAASGLTNEIEVVRPSLRKLRSITVFHRTRGRTIKGRS